MFAKASPGALIIAAVVFAMGVGLVALTAMAPTSPMYSRVGPTAFPYAIGAGMILMGLLLARDAVKARWRCEAIDEPEVRLDYKAIGFVIAGFVAAMLLVRTAGFIIAGTALFTLATIAFGEKRWWLSVPIGFAIAFVTFVLFAKLLGLRMGSGLIEGLL